MNDDSFMSADEAEEAGGGGGGGGISDHSQRFRRGQLQQDFLSPLKPDTDTARRPFSFHQRPNTPDIPPTSGQRCLASVAASNAAAPSLRVVALSAFNPRTQRRIPHRCLPSFAPKKKNLTPPPSPTLSFTTQTVRRRRVILRAPAVSHAVPAGCRGVEPPSRRRWRRRRGQRQPHGRRHHDGLGHRARPNRGRDCGLRRLPIG